MGAAQSMDGSVGWGDCVPEFQMLRLGPSDMRRLLVPATAAHACGLSAGGLVFMRDCLGYGSRVILRENAGAYCLASGWTELLRRFDCRCGDVMVLKYKEARTWRIRVFCGSSGFQKSPVIAVRGAVDSLGESSRAHSNDEYADGVALVGSMGRPIEIDAPNPRTAVYNATGDGISTAMGEFISSISSLFNLLVPLYYTVLSEVHVTCNFFPFALGYGDTYLVPIVQDRGCPDHALLFLNGSDDPYSVKFKKYKGVGTFFLGEGVSKFFRDHSIEQGTDVLLRFDWSHEPLKIHVYDF